MQLFALEQGLDSLEQAGLDGGGELSARTDARSRLVFVSLLSLLGIALVLYADFRSLRIHGAESIPTGATWKLSCAFKNRPGLNRCKCSIIRRVFSRYR